MKLRNSKLIFITALAAICIQFRAAVASTELQLINGSYHKLLVFYDGKTDIPQSAEYHAERLMRLRDGFSRASGTISRLTEPLGRRLAFNDVTVLVPAQLGRELEKVDPKILRVRPRPATWQQRDRADFYITSNVAEANEGPRWDNNEGCGKPPSKVEVAFESLDHSQENKLGPRLALFFSQYRWCLRSEAPTDGLTYQVRHMDGSEHWLVASCSQTLKTELRVASGVNKGQLCALNDTTQLKDCAIEVTERPFSYAASFLFAPYGPGVHRFCESAKLGMDHKLVHNRNAKNDFNKHCPFKSAADVVKEHKDFQQTGSSAPAGTATQFEVVFEPESRRVVVVLDTSTRMQGARLAAMMGAVTQYLANVLNDGSEVALIRFDHNASVLHHFVKIDSPDVRKRLMQSVATLTAGGYTCIGRAAQEAMKLLGADPVRPSRSATGTIIMFTDGTEACSDWLALDRSIGALSQTSIQVHTIRFGDQADKRMSNMSKVTGGKEFFVAIDQSGSMASDLHMTLEATNSDVAGDNRTVIICEKKKISPLFWQPIEFNIDASIRRNLALTLYFSTEPSQAAKLRLMVRSPSGKTFNCTGSSDGLSTVDPKTGTATVRIPDADIEVGRWTLKNLAVGAIAGGRRKRQTTGFGGFGALVIAATASPSVTKEGSNKLPVLDGHVWPTKVPNITELSSVKVAARLSIGGYGKCIRNARMYAIVSINSSIEVARFDLTLCVMCDYANGKIPPHAVKSAGQYTVIAKSVFPVKRVKFVGTLTVDAENPHFNGRLTPPDAITNFNVYEDFDNLRVVVWWSPVEDHSGLLPPGSHVPYYIIRYSIEPEDLETNFTVLASTNETSIDVWEKFLAIGEIRLFIQVVGVSAANVTGKIALAEIIRDIRSTAKLLKRIKESQSVSTVSTVSTSQSKRKTVSTAAPPETQRNPSKKHSSDRSAASGACILASVIIWLWRIGWVSN